MLYLYFYLRFLNLILICQKYHSIRNFLYKHETSLHQLDTVNWRVNTYWVLHIFGSSFCFPLWAFKTLLWFATRYFIIGGKSWNYVSWIFRICFWKCCKKYLWYKLFVATLFSFRALRERNPRIFSLITLPFLVKNKLFILI